MKPTGPGHPWPRLTNAARRMRDERETAAPYGFSTRVAALALAAERRAISLVERFAIRALGVASLLALLSVAVNYPVLTRLNSPATGPGAEEIMAPMDDAIAVVLEATD